MAKYFNSERSTNYRRTFFIHNKPLIKNIYFCAYCGMPVRKKKLTVDHLYPIYKAQHSRRLRRKLQRKGINDINDARNLVPACRMCNQHKSSKLGWLWIVRGELGRIQWLWIPRHIIRICIVIALILYIKCTLLP